MQGHARQDNLAVATALCAIADRQETMGMLLSLLPSCGRKGTVERQKRDLLLREVCIRAVGKDKRFATLRVRGKKEMKTPQTADSSAFHLDRMDPPVQNRQIINFR